MIESMDHWWRTAVFYEIYMPSFCDGNHDGIGDFKGITAKLDYLKSLGVDGLWLTPFYKSPKVDNGYDIADYREIDSDYGTMADFDHFIAEAHKRDIKVIADLVLNHTSSDHPWFQESKASKDSPKRDWYIWRDPGEAGQVPNNWESFFGGTAWEFDAETGQYYYHAFAKEQVDLNWANPEVKKAMFDSMAFWLDKGIDGFRLDVINFLTVKQTFKNNPYDEEKAEQIHLYDKDQEGILDVIQEIAGFVHQYGDKFLVGEVGSEDIEVLKEYSGKNKLDVVFNFNLGSLPVLDVNGIHKQLVATEEAYGEDQLPTLFFSSHDMPRFTSRFKETSASVKERAELIGALMLTAKGVPFIYFGDEIGMSDLVIEKIADMRDIQGLIAYERALADGKSESEALAIANKEGRDKSRSPMQWDASEFVGFSSAKPWISIPENAHAVNVAKQSHETDSVLAFYRRLLQLRKENPALHSGDYAWLKTDGSILRYLKEKEDSKVLVMLNFSAEPAAVSIEDAPYEWLLSNKRKKVESQPLSMLQPFEVVLLLSTEVTK
jgi:glycosidase